MTPGERAIWGAAFARRLLDRAKPSDHAMASTEAYAAWESGVALDAAGCASDVLRFARIALAVGRHREVVHGESPPWLREIHEMLGVAQQQLCGGDAACGGVCMRCQALAAQKDPSAGA